MSNLARALPRAAPLGPVHVDVLDRRPLGVARAEERDLPHCGRLAEGHDGPLFGGQATAGERTQDLEGVGVDRRLLHIPHQPGRVAEPVPVHHGLDQQDALTL